MEEIGSKAVREEIHITPAKVERIQYVQQSYVCPQCRTDYPQSKKRLFHTLDVPQHGIHLSSFLCYVSEMRELSAILPPGWMMRYK